MGVFAICDSESNYLYRIMEYLEPQISQLFEMHSFSNVQSLKEYATNNPVELLLISNKVIGEWIRELKCVNVLLLSEGEKRLEFQEYTTIYKYQSAQEIYRQVMYWYSQQEKVLKNTSYIPLKQVTSLIGFYSPWHDSFQTSLAMAFGQLEGKEKNTLYLNLKGYNGFSRYMDCSYTRDLIDLIYYFKSKRSQFANYLQSVICKTKDLDYVPPVENPMGIKEVTALEWLDFLGELSCATKYETIILDLTDEVENSLELLEICSYIYIPIRKEKSVEGKLEQLDKTLIAQGKQKFQDKIVKIEIDQGTIENLAMKIHKNKKEED